MQCQLPKRCLACVAPLFLATVHTLTAEEANETAQGKADARLFRVVLEDGSKITGTLSVSHVDCQTEFGRLQIPITKLRAVVPGLDRRPQEKQRIQQLVERLNDAKQRDAAREEFLDLGPAVCNLLRQHRENVSDQHQQQIDNVLDTLQEMAEEEIGQSHPLVRQDTVETPKFTVVGKVFPEKVTITTQFGDLAVALADIEHLEWFRPDHRPDVRKSLAVDGTNLVQLKFKNTRITVEPGDRIVVRARGRISRSGSSSYFSFPDGNSRLGTLPNNILGGTLVARIGRSGKLIKVGSRSSFLAKQSGTLQLAIGMRPDYVGRYRFIGKYDVTVRVARGDE